MSLHAGQWACMQLHKLACSSLSLHAVKWAYMKFHELVCSFMSLHAVPFFVWAAHKNFIVLVICIIFVHFCSDCQSLSRYIPPFCPLVKNSFHEVLVYFISIIIIGPALPEIISHQPQNLSVSSRHLYVLGIYGDLQLEVILILRPEAKEHVFNWFQTKYWKMSRESACETNTLCQILLSDW